MVDPRFYEALGPISAAALAPEADAQGHAERPIAGLAPAHAAGAADLAWIEGKAAQPVSPEAGAVLVRPRDRALVPEGVCALVTAHPRAVFAKASVRLFRERMLEAGPPVSPLAEIEPGARIGPGAVIGAGAKIGADAVIGALAVIGPGVAIGRGSSVGAHASVFCALVGDGVTILPGARIGQAGFAVAGGPDGPVDVAHFGRVVLMDRCSVGAGTTIDRGLFDDTIVGEDAKIDNLCQIGHNVVVGRGAIIAACAGISGSTVIGDGAMLGGRVGVSDHRRLGARAMLAAGSAVMHDVPDGETWGGYPAKPIRRWLREVAWLSRAAGRRDDQS